MSNKVKRPSSCVCECVRVCLLHHVYLWLWVQFKETKSFVTCGFQKSATKTEDKRRSCASVRACVQSCVGSYLVALLRVMSCTRVSLFLTLPVKTASASADFDSVLTWQAVGVCLTVHVRACMQQAGCIYFCIAFTGHCCKPQGNIGYIIQACQTPLCSTVLCSCACIYVYILTCTLKGNVIPPGRPVEKKV